jgi:hypothetical protein
MFCVKCGVKLADTEKICPLCGTTVYHPDIVINEDDRLYPAGRKPKTQTNAKVINGMLIILFMIPIFVCFLSDYMINGFLNWFGFAAGGILWVYIVFVLPLWFKKPNPVIFVPCDFAASALYLLYIDIAIGGGWFLSFAFPLIGALCLIISACVTLCYYIKRGHLYIWGGTFIAMGAYTLLIEFFLGIAFGIRFIGWSIYPLMVLTLLGGMLIYLAINRSAREMMERKLFF